MCLVLLGGCDGVSQASPPGSATESPLDRSWFCSVKVAAIDSVAALDRSIALLRLGDTERSAAEARAIHAVVASAMKEPALGVPPAGDPISFLAWFNVLLAEQNLTYALAPDLKPIGVASPDIELERQEIDRKVAAARGYDESHSREVDSCR